MAFCLPCLSLFRAGAGPVPNRVRHICGRCSVSVGWGKRTNSSHVWQWGPLSRRLPVQVAVPPQGWLAWAMQEKAQPYVRTS